jgi:hypothetical protein
MQLTSSTAPLPPLQQHSSCTLLQRPDQAPTRPLRMIKTLQEKAKVAVKSK